MTRISIILLPMILLFGILISISTSAMAGNNPQHRGNGYYQDQRHEGHHGRDQNRHYDKHHGKRNYGHHYGQRRHHRHYGYGGYYSPNTQLNFRYRNHGSIIEFNYQPYQAYPRHRRR